MLVLNNTEFKPGEPVLDWSARKRVARGTARALEYLHEQCNPKIIHRDVKAANVLLDEAFEPVVGDFGLAKLVDVRITSVTTRICGTLGKGSTTRAHSLASPDEIRGRMTCA